MDSGDEVPLDDPDEEELEALAREGDIYACLLLAIRSNDVSTIRKAVKNGADLQRQAYLMHWLEEADRWDNMEAFKELLRLKAPLPDDIGSDEWGSLHYALRRGDKDLARLLSEAGAKLDIEGPMAERPKDVHEATQWGRLDDVKAFLEKDPSLIKALCGEFKVTLLHIAAHLDEVELVQHLLHAGADPNAVDGNGYGITPLHWAAEYGAFQSAKLLLDAGASIDAQLDVNCGEHGKRTPLLMSIYFGHRDVAEFLVARGDNLNLADGSLNETPLHWTSRDDFWLNVTRMMVAKGAEIDPLNTCRRTPLHNAVNNEAVETVKFLMASGANPDQKEKDGTTPRQTAMESGNATLIATFKKIR